MRSIVRVQSISPRPQFHNFSRDTVPLQGQYHNKNASSKLSGIIFFFLWQKKAVSYTSSRKITEVKQLVPWLALGWVTIQVLKWIDAVVKNTIKSQEWRNRASNKNSWGKKRKKEKEKRFSISSKQFPLYSFCMRTAHYVKSKKAVFLLPKLMLPCYFCLRQAAYK